MAKANSTRITRAPKGAIPAPNDEARRRSGASPINPMCRAVPMDKFNKATLKLNGARALVSLFGIFAGEVENGEPIPVSGETINSAMNGIDLLIESAIDDLLATEGGAQ